MFNRIIFLAAVFVSWTALSAQQSKQPETSSPLAGAEDTTVKYRPPADTGLLIDQFLPEILANNPGLQAARSRIRSASARVPQAKAWEDPQIAFESYATPVTSSNPFKDGMENDYSIEQTIPFFGKKGLMGEAAEAGMKISEQSAAAVERDLIARTKSAFGMLYSAQKRLGVIEENQRIISRILASTLSKYGVGIGSQSDILKVQVEQSKLQNEQSILGQERESAEAMLNALRAKPASTPIGRIADIDPRPIGLSYDSILARSLQGRPELRGMNYEIVMHEADLEAAKRDWLPDLTIRGTYKQMRDQTDNWAAMIGINIPIAPWGIGKYSGRIEEKEVDLEAGEQTLNDMRNMVQSEVRNTYTKVESQWDRIKRYQGDILPQAEQSLDASLASYTVDKTDILSLLDSFRMLQMLRMEYYMVMGDYFNSVAALERAVGSDIY